MSLEKQCDDLEKNKELEWILIPPFLTFVTLDLSELQFLFQSNEGIVQNMPVKENPLFFLYSLLIPWHSNSSNQYFLTCLAHYKRSLPLISVPMAILLNSKICSPLYS